MNTIARIITIGTAAAIVLAAGLPSQTSIAQPADKQDDKGQGAAKQQQAPPARQSPAPPAARSPERQMPPVAREPAQPRQAPASDSARREGSNRGVVRKQSDEERPRRAARERSEARPKNQNAPGDAGARASRQQPAERAQERTQRDQDRTRQQSKQEPVVKDVDRAEKQPQTKPPQSKTGESAAPRATSPPVALSQEQRVRVRQSFSQQRPQRLTRVNFSISVGSRIPRTARLFPVPASVIAIVPAYQAYRYVYVDDRICIVDPVTFTIVEVIDEVSPGGSSVTTAGLELTQAQREFVLTNIRRSDARVNINIGLALGAEVPSDITLRLFPSVVVRTVPKLQSYRYIVVDDDVVIVDPRDRDIALVIRR